MSDPEVVGGVAFHERDERQGVHLRGPSLMTLCGIDFGGDGWWTTFFLATPDTPVPDCDECLELAGWL